MAERVQQSKLAALGRLSASIAHEIRNPVGAMSHAGQLLAESPGLGREERRLTDIIRSNSERVSTIINNVLQLSRREATRPERLLLGEWLKDFVQEFCCDDAGAAARIDVKMDAEDVEVRFDPTHLHQVGLEPVRQRAQIRRRRPDPSVEVEVRPAGPRQRAAVPGGRRPRPGHRGKRRRSDFRAVLHRAQGRHGTRAVHRARAVPAESRRPAVRAARRRRQRVPRRIQRPAALGGMSHACATIARMPKPAVLVVDDEPDLCELLSITLERMNLDPTAVDTVSAAQRLLKAGRFDLCLTDMQLPDGDGLELVAVDAANTRRDVPVAVITAHGNVETAVRALKLGAFDFVSKPLDLGGLAQAGRHGDQARRHAATATRSDLSDRACSGALGRDATPARDDRARRAQPGAGAHLRRVGHRQGTGRQADP